MEDQLYDRIEILFDHVRALHDDCPKDVVASYLDRVDEYRSILMTSKDDKKGDYELMLSKIHERLLSLANVFDKSTPFLANVDYTQLDLTEKLGSGQFGTVYKTKIADTPVAVKVLRSKNPTDLEKFTREANVASKISHPNIVRHMCVVKGREENEVCIVSEYCDKDMMSYVTSNPDGISVPRIIKWFCQAAAGLCWMHNVCRMIHRDVKPANILIKSDDTAVLTDFGFTEVVDKADETIVDEKCHGSPYFMAPELLAGRPFSYSIDVFALAMSIFAALKKGAPYDIQFSNRRELYNALMKGVRPNFSSLTVEFPLSLRTLLTECWATEPSRRPNMITVFERLKDIYIESIVPKEKPFVINALLPQEEPLQVTKNPAFLWWSEHFRDLITDTVSLAQASSAMPSDFPIFPKYYLDHIASGDVVKLKELDLLVCWYGNWLDKGNREKTACALAKSPWFIGYSTYGESTELVRSQWERTKEGCFLVRSSKTDPVNSPFTLTLCSKDGAITHHRVRANEKRLLSCTSLENPRLKAVCEGDLLSFIEKLRENGLPERPYVPYVKAKDMYV